MLARFRQRLTYANVMSTAAVFIALGGSSYAALHIDSADIANNSVRGVDVRNRSLSERELKRNALGGRSIRESRLGRVPHAREADLLTGMSAADLLLKCPSGTFPIADVCVETTSRQPASYGVGGSRVRNYRCAGGTRTTATHPRRAAGRAQRSSTRARRGADLRGVPELDRWRARRRVRDRPGRKRRDHAEHRRWREGLPLRRRPQQLRTPDARPLQHGREEMSSLSAHLRQSEDHSRLRFHPACPVCRHDRLAGSLTGDELVSRRVQAALAAGLMAFSTSGASVAVASEPDEVSEGTSEVLAPGDAGSNADFDPGSEAMELPDEAPAAPEPVQPPLPTATISASLEQEPATDVVERVASDVVSADPSVSEAPPAAPPASDAPQADGAPPVAEAAPGDSGPKPERAERRAERPAKHAVVSGSRRRPGRRASRARRRGAGASRRRGRSASSPARAPDMQRPVTACTSSTAASPCGRSPPTCSETARASLAWRMR